MLGIAALRENALALIRWQPVQWQAIVIIGAAVIRNRTCPHRHPPSNGENSLLMIYSSFALELDCKFEAKVVIALSAPIRLCAASPLSAPSSCQAAD
jgi:hypothetical protein